MATSPRVAALLDRIAQYPRPLSPADQAAVQREMVALLLRQPAAPPPFRSS